MSAARHDRHCEVCGLRNGDHRCLECNKRYPSIEELIAHSRSDRILVAAITSSHAAVQVRGAGARRRALATTTTLMSTRRRAHTRSTRCRSPRRLRPKMWRCWLVARRPRTRKTKRSAKPATVSMMRAPLRRCCCQRRRNRRAAAAANRSGSRKEFAVFGHSSKPSTSTTQYDLFWAKYAPVQVQRIVLFAQPYFKPLGHGNRSQSLWRPFTRLYGLRFVDVQHDADAGRIDQTTTTRM